MSRVSLTSFGFCKKGEGIILLDISSGNTYKHLVEQSKGAVKEGGGPREARALPISSTKKKVHFLQMHNQGLQ